MVAIFDILDLLFLSPHSFSLCLSVCLSVSLILPALPRYHPAEDPEALEHADEIKELKFYPGDPPASKKIWKCGVEQHTFFRLQRPERSSKLQNVFRRGTKFR